MNDEDIQGTKNKGSGLASLTQLVAKGPDSDYIHKDATAHLFQGEYLKHTPFIINNESFVTTIQFEKEYRFKIPFKGDFIKDLFFKFKLPKIGNNIIKWKQKVSQRIIKELYITVNNIDIFYLDDIYTGIYNLLDKDISQYFKINVTEIDFVSYCYVQIPVWNKTSIRQFLPINSLHDSDIRINFTISEKNKFLQEFSCHLE